MRFLQLGHQRLGDVTPSVWISIIVSILALGISFLNLYLSQLRYKSELSAFVSDITVTGGWQVEQIDNGVAINQGVQISLALTNSGNAPSSLQKIFWIVPNSMNYDCAKSKNIDWELLSANYFHLHDFQGTAFSFKAAVVPASSIVVAEGSIEPRKVVRTKDQFGTKTMCIAFVSMDYAGNVVVSSIPAYQLTVDNNSVAEEGASSIKHPVDLLKSN